MNQLRLYYNAGFFLLILLQVFQDILKDDKVKGKPILMLCNKADIEEAKDEVHVVNVLNVEKLVNVAKCPTRVEPSIATKNNGIKDGFKWLVKSVIANIADLGPRIVKDVEEEEKKEAIRKEELRKRLEEEKMLQNESIGGGEGDEIDGEEMQPPGFVPISEAIKAKEVVENEVKPEGILFRLKTHHSKSPIFVQKFNFDKTPTFSRVFHPNFF